jgi:hypothetical protein
MSNTHGHNAPTSGSEPRKQHKRVNDKAQAEGRNERQEQGKGLQARTILDTSTQTSSGGYHKFTHTFAQIASCAASQARVGG